MHDCKAVGSYDSSALVSGTPHFTQCRPFELGLAVNGFQKISTAALTEKDTLPSRFWGKTLVETILHHHQTPGCSKEIKPG